MHKARILTWLWVGLVALVVTSRAEAAYVSLLITDVGQGVPSGLVTQYDANSGAPTKSGVFTTTTGLNPRGIAVDSSGDVYISDLSSQTIQKFNASGTLIPGFSVTGLNGPGPLAIGPDGDVYVSNFNASTIMRFDPTTGAPIGSGVFASTGFSGPTGIAFGPNGDLYVSSSSNSTLVELNGTTGVVEKSITGIGLINGPAGLSFGVSPSGTLYVADYSDNKILQFDSSLNYIGVFSSISALSGPAGLAFDSNGKLIVVNNTSGTVIRLNADGTLDTTLVTGLEQPLYAAFSNFSAVPEPTSMALMFIGLAGVAIVQGRKSRLQV